MVGLFVAAMAAVFFLPFLTVVDGGESPAVAPHGAAAVLPFGVGVALFDSNSILRGCYIWCCGVDASKRKAGDSQCCWQYVFFHRSNTLIRAGRNLINFNNTTINSGKLSDSIRLPQKPKLLRNSEPESAIQTSRSHPIYHRSLKNRKTDLPLIVRLTL